MVNIFSCLIDIYDILYLLLLWIDWSQGPTEKDQIDVQGDISYDIVEFITETWPDVSAFNCQLFDIKNSDLIYISGKRQPFKYRRKKI